LVVHVLVAQRDADGPLPDQGWQRMQHLVLLAAIHKARSNRLDQPNRLIAAPQQ
jgi:hypothetical protein